MRTIERTGQFKRDYKRIVKGAKAEKTVRLLVAVIDSLAHDRPLADRHRDHALTGDWRDHRDCHVHPDLVLVYRKPHDDVVQLVRLGSHSELGL